MEGTTDGHLISPQILQLRHVWAILRNRDQPEMHGRCCSVCQFQGPDAIGKPSSSQFSCKMKPNANVIVEVKGDVHYVKNVYGIEGPPMGGDVAEKLVTSSLSFSNTSIPLTHSVPGPVAKTLKRNGATVPGSSARQFRDMEWVA